MPPEDQGWGERRGPGLGGEEGTRAGGRGGEQGGGVRRGAGMRRVEGARVGE